MVTGLILLNEANVLKGDGGKKRGRNGCPGCVTLSSLHVPVEEFLMVRAEVDFCLFFVSNVWVEGWMDYLPLTSTT